MWSSCGEQVTNAHMRRKKNSVVASEDSHSRYTSCGTNPFGQGRLSERTGVAALRNQRGGLHTHIVEMFASPCTELNVWLEGTYDWGAQPLRCHNGCHTNSTCILVTSSFSFKFLAGYYVGCAPHQHFVPLCKRRPTHAFCTPLSASSSPVAERVAATNLAGGCRRLPRVRCACVHCSAD